MYLKLIFIFSVLGGSWAACPSAKDAAPCTCNEDKLQFTCNSSTSEGSGWDIKAYFDRIATLIPRNAVFESILITETNLTNIPAGAIQTVKFNKIDIHLNSFLEYIHPDAFGETTNVTTHLSITTNHKLTNEGEGHTERDVFDVIAKFKNATEIIIHYNRIRYIPDEGFGPLPNLKTIWLDWGNFHRIGKRAFSQLPNLEFVEMSNSLSLSPDVFDIDAFDGVGPNAEIQLLYNPNISRLPEFPFKKLLDNARLVAVGGQYCLGVWCVDDELDCDAESAWMCQDIEKYRSKVNGFFCKKSTGYETIWDYCAGEVNNEN